MSDSQDSTVLRRLTYLLIGALVGYTVSLSTCHRIEAESRLDDLEVAVCVIQCLQAIPAEVPGREQICGAKCASGELLDKAKGAAMDAVIDRLVTP